MKQLYFLLAILFPVVVNTSCKQHKPDAANVPLVRIDTARAAEGETMLQYPGKVRAAQDVSLSFRVSGTLNRILVKDGARVSEGQLLAELDPTDYQVQLDATEAEYEQIKSEAERVIALYRDNGTTPAANDKAVYGLKQISAKYQHHKDQLAYTRLYAPFSGYVQKRLFDAHETVAAGMPVISMISGGMPEVEINLPAAEYIRRESFSNYHCTFDIYPGQTYPLKLISITPKANANQLYTMRLQLSAEGRPVPSPGMNTMVTIRCADESGVTSLSVPTGAILRKDGKTWVYAYRPSDGTVHLCEVTPLRLLNNGRTVVTSVQLAPNEQVVASGVNHLKDGDSVKLLPPASETNVGGLL
ncbi:MAG: efflux RND transporter periplasmic adaptor subunit [Bacteroidales bacterium]|nr:efflux RND transporter periplasmic adaptor subunit [Bacteroidales bacterium]